MEDSSTSIDKYPSYYKHDECEGVAFYLNERPEALESMVIDLNKQAIYPDGNMVLWGHCGPVCYKCECDISAGEGDPIDYIYLRDENDKAD